MRLKPGFAPSTSARRASGRMSTAGGGRTTTLNRTRSHRSKAGAYCGQRGAARQPEPLFINVSAVNDRSVPPIASGGLPTLMSPFGSSVAISCDSSCCDHRKAVQDWSETFDALRRMSAISESCRPRDCGPNGWSRRHRHIWAGVTSSARSGGTRTTAVSTRQLEVSTQTCPSGFSEAARRSDRPLAGFASVKQPFIATRTRPGAVIPRPAAFR